MNTMQQEFDAVVTHLYKQGRQASENGACKYRVLGRGAVLSCAVGCRIPDDVYNIEMDEPADGGGTALHLILPKFGSILPPEISAYSDMFKELQQVHDGSDVDFSGEFDFDRLTEGLENVAIRFGLTFTKPEGY